MDSKVMARAEWQHELSKMQFLDRPAQDMATSANAEGLGSDANEVDERLSHSSKTSTDQERVRVVLARLLLQGAEVDASSETGHTGSARIARIC